MVIPRQEVDHWDDLPPALAAHLFQVSQKLAKAIKQAFPAKRVGMIIAGLEVPHTHIHLFPMDQMAEMDFSRAKDASAEHLATVAQQLRDAMAAQS